MWGGRERKQETHLVKDLFVEADQGVEVFILRVTCVSASLSVSISHNLSLFLCPATITTLHAPPPRANSMHTKTRASSSMTTHAHVYAPTTQCMYIHIQHTYILSCTYFHTKHTHTHQTRIITSICVHYIHLLAHAHTHTHTHKNVGQLTLEPSCEKPVSF